MSIYHNRRNTVEQRREKGKGKKKRKWRNIRKTACMVRERLLRRGVRVRRAQMYKRRLPSFVAY